MGCKIASDHPGLPVALLGGAAFGLLAAADRLFLGRRFNLLETKRLLAGLATVVAFAGVAEAFIWLKGCSGDRLGREGEEAPWDINDMLEEMRLRGNVHKPLAFSLDDEDAEQAYLADHPDADAITSRSKDATESQLYWLVMHANREQFSAVLKPHLNNPEKLVTLFKIVIKRIEANDNGESDLNPVRMEALCHAAGELEKFSVSILLSLNSDKVISAFLSVWGQDPAKLLKLAQACIRESSSINNSKTDLFIENAALQAIDALIEADKEKGRWNSKLFNHPERLLNRLTALYIEECAGNGGQPEEVATRLETVLKECNRQSLKEIAGAGETMPASPLWWLVAAPQALGIGPIADLKWAIRKRFIAGECKPQEIREEILPTLLAITEVDAHERIYYTCLEEFASSYSKNLLGENQFNSVMAQVFKPKPRNQYLSLNNIPNIGALLDIALDSPHLDKEARWADAFVNCMGWTEVSKLEVGVDAKVRSLCQKLGKRVPDLYQ